MRATEIIRGVLDLIDQIECAAQPTETEVVAVTPVEDPVQTGVDQNRFKQIFDLLSSKQAQMYDNSPAEVVAGIESVTTNAGGGLNGPKNPADIRADSVSMYPNFQAK
jgi:hypothetical protein